MEILSIFITYYFSCTFLITLSTWIKTISMNCPYVTLSVFLRENRLSQTLQTKSFFFCWFVLVGVVTCVSMGSHTLNEFLCEFSCCLSAGMFLGIQDNWKLVSPLGPCCELENAFSKHLFVLQHNHIDQIWLVFST